MTQESKLLRLFLAFLKGFVWSSYNILHLMDGDMLEEDTLVIMCGRSIEIS